MGVLKEFRDFAVQGNVVDLAVGLIIGAEFGKIVNSLVQDVIMPPLGLIVGGVDFRNLFFLLRDPNGKGPFATLAEAQKAGAITVNIGTFFSSVLSFAIIAFAVFLLVRAFNRIKGR